MTGEVKACRICGEMNPDTNQYCKECGRLLNVTTKEMRAQRRPILPVIRKLRLRWILAGIPVTLGAAALGLAGSIALTLLVPSIAPSTREGSLSFLLSFGTTTIVQLVFFFIGGFVLSWIAGESGAAEPAVAAFVTVILGGFVGAVYSPDVLIIAFLMAVPATICAAFGGWFARFVFKFRS